MFHLYRICSLMRSRRPNIKVNAFMENNGVSHARLASAFMITTEINVECAAKDFVCMAGERIDVEIATPVFAFITDGNMIAIFAKESLTVRPNLGSCLGL